MNETSFASSDALGINIPTLLSSSTSSTFSVLASSVLVAFVVSVIYGGLLNSRLSTVGKFWNAEPWIADPSQWFSHMRAEMRSFKNSRQMLDEGYEKFSKKGKAFVMPLMGNKRYLVLPPTDIRELLSKPDKEVNEKVPHEEALQGDYTIRNPLMKKDSFHFDVVRRELTRKLPLLTTDVHDELCYGLKTLWSDSSKEWNTVQIYPSAMRIVSRAANRVFAGTHLCRNDEFLEHSKLYSQGTFGGAAMINMFPPWLHPIVGPIITYPNRRNLAICCKHAEPVIQERLENTAKKLADPSYDWDVPTDALQWLIELILERGEAAEMAPRQICHRLLGLNMVAIHTTSMVMANAIMDLYGAPNASELVAGLRDECERVLAASGGVWTKNAVNDLVRVDSAVRETMRFSDLGNMGLHRLVVADKGADFHGGAIHVPKGVRVAIPTYNMHHDHQYYPDPHTYDPFRFSAPREEHDRQKLEAQGKDDQQRTLELKNQALITVGDQFLAFGHGRHACPGRFFAAQEMKLMLAEIVMSYDVELVGGKRPSNVQIGSVSVPPSDAEIRVKRRA